MLFGSSLAQAGHAASRQIQAFERIKDQPRRGLHDTYLSTLQQDAASIQTVLYRRRYVHGTMFGGVLICYVHYFVRLGDLSHDSPLSK